MIEKHIRYADLVGKTIDIHSHAGIQIREAAQISFPYCASVEDLAYRQRANGVDVSVVFPTGPDLFFDLQLLIETGRRVPAATPDLAGALRAREPPPAYRRLQLLSRTQRPLPALYLGGSGPAGRRADRDPMRAGGGVPDLRRQDRAGVHPDPGDGAAGRGGGVLRVLRRAGLAGPVPRGRQPGRGVFPGGRHPPRHRAPPRAALLPGALHRLPPGVARAGRQPAQRLGGHLGPQDPGGAGAPG